MATAKQVARDLLDALPEDCTLEDISYHVYVRAKGEEGFQDLSTDRATPQRSGAPPEGLKEQSRIAEMLEVGLRKAWSQCALAGFAEGIRVTSRHMCFQAVLRHHPAVLSLVEPVIKACSSPFHLAEWATASEISDEAFVVLVTGKRSTRVTRARASRPSGREKRR
jgi:hypothetical protein